MSIILHEPTGQPQLDHALSSMISAFEAALPDKIAGYYLYGSQIDGSAVATSDIDVTLVFRRILDEGRRENTMQIFRAVNTILKLPLDLSLTDLEALKIEQMPDFKLASHLLYGEDIRDQIPMPTVERWTHDRMHTSYWRLIHLFKRPLPVSLPLQYPDPKDEFFGYFRQPSTLADGRTVYTRNFIRAITWAATALIALQGREFVLRKSDVIPLYSAKIGGKWAKWLEQVYVNLKMRWAYEIPKGQGERQALRELCRDAVGFENEFMAQYRRFLLSELWGSDQKRRDQAVRVMQHNPLNDPDVRVALQALKQGL